MNKIRFLSPDCEMQILLFLWQWKLATSATLGFRFFKGQSSRHVYKKLYSLESYGYIESHSNEHIGHSVWVLSRKGYGVIEKILPELKEGGFKSECLYHDFLVNALHLGDWLKDRPKSVEIFTEQQLRRFDLEFYPSWVPRNIAHRPDGYFHFKNGNGQSTVALEVEINLKQKSTYSGVGGFYASSPEINRVVWVVPTPKSISTLQRKFNERDSTSEQIHNFILLKQFIESGWNAEIKAGPEHTHTLGHFFRTLAGANVQEDDGRGRETPPHLFLCDSRKWSFIPPP